MRWGSAMTLGNEVYKVVSTASSFCEPSKSFLLEVLTTTFPLLSIYKFTIAMPARAVRIRTKPLGGRPQMGDNPAMYIVFL